MNYSEHGLPQVPSINYATICLTVQSGTMLNWEQWIPHQRASINLAVSLDSQLVYHAEIDSKITLAKSIDDQAQTHCLSLKFSGFTDDSIVIMDGVRYQPVIKIAEFWIEGVPANLMLQTHARFVNDTGEVEVGNDYVGNNGTLELEFATPIYQWLLAQGPAVASSTRYFYQKDK